MEIPEKYHRTFQEIDTKTGVVITTVCSPKAKLYLGKKRLKHPGDFMIFFCKGVLEVTQLLRGKGELIFVVWMTLSARMVLGKGSVTVNTCELSEVIKTDRANVSRALKALVELGVIERMGKDRQHVIYRLNPQIAWRGRESERQAALEHRAKPVKPHVLRQVG